MSGSTFTRLLLICFVVSGSFVLLARPVLADQTEDSTRRVAKQLQCPVCSGASVADSPSDLAGQMRAVIRAKVQAGESDDQIVAYFVERYGDGILIEPPRRGIGLAVWLMPLAMLVVGGVVLWRLTQSWLRPRWAPLTTASAPPTSPHQNGTSDRHEPEPPSSVDRARAELDRFRRES